MSSKASIEVVIIGAQGLRRADATGKSDPYCVCEVLGKTSKKFASFRTRVQENTCDPAWNCTREFENYAPGDSLKFTIFDKDADGHGDDTLGVAELEASRFYPEGFRGLLPLLEAGRGAGADVGVIVSVEVRKLAAEQVGLAAITNVPLLRERALVELRRESIDVPWGIELEGPWITIGKIPPKSVAGRLASETAENGKPLGLRAGDTVLRMNGISGSLTKMSSQLSKEQRLLEILVQRLPRRDAQVQADSVTLGYPHAGVQAAGATIAITSNTFVAHLPLKSEQIEDEKIGRIADIGLEEKYLALEKRLRQELSEAAIEIASLQRQLDRERKESRERVERMEEALRQSRLTYGGRMYAIEATDVQPSDNARWLRDLTEALEGRERHKVPEARPTPAKKASKRKVPQGASREDLAFLGERELAEVSVPDLHLEVQRLEERLLGVRQEAIARSNQEQDAKGSQEIALGNAAPSPPPPAAMFRMVLQRLYEAEVQGAVDTWDIPDGNIEAEQEFY